MKYIYYALLFTGLLILLIRRKTVETSLLVFIPMYGFDIATEIASDLSARAFFLYHIDQAVDCGLLCLYYYLVLKGNRYRRLVWVGFALYLTFCALYFIRNPPLFFKFDPIDFVVEGVFMTMFALYYLINLYRSDIQTRLSRHPHFWISTGNLLFFSGAAFFMGFAYTLANKNLPLYRELSYIVYFLNLMLYSIYIKAFLCPSPEKTLN
jgi:hypothetical protein